MVVKAFAVLVPRAVVLVSWLSQQLAKMEQQELDVVGLEVVHAFEPVAYYVFELAESLLMFHLLVVEASGVVVVEVHVLL